MYNQTSVFEVIDMDRKTTTKTLLESYESIGAENIEAGGQGLGKQIMTELEALASKNDTPEITLSVSLPSKHFYEHLNCHILENAQIDVGGGQYLNYSIGTKKI